MGRASYHLRLILTSPRRANYETEEETPYEVIRFLPGCCAKRDQP